MRAGKTLGAGILILATFSPMQFTAEAAGRSTTAAVNTILNGRGAPKSSLGIDGDFYIDTRSLLIYGPKRKGKWPAPQSIQGPTGPSGNDGRNGSDGKTVSASNVNTVVGPQGIQGAIGPVGPQGEKGEQGLPGATGASGAPGISGSAGASGANGAQGPAGPIGPAGAMGAKGETGTSGSSEVTVIDIPTWTLSSSTPFSFSTSSASGILLANNSYSFHMQIKGSSVFNSMVLGLEILSPGNTVSFVYSRNNIRYAGNSAISTLYTFDVIGTIKVSDSDGSVQVRVIDGFGDSGTNVLTLTGKAYITSVGAIR